MRPWTFEKFLILLKEFEGEHVPKDISLWQSSFWVQIHNLPLKSRTKEMGWAIRTKLGEVMDVDILESEKNETKKGDQDCQARWGDHEIGKGGCLDEQPRGILPFSGKEKFERDGAQKPSKDKMQWETGTCHGEEKQFEFRMVPSFEGEKELGISVSSDGRSGILAMLWREGVVVSFKSCTNSHIDMVVYGERGANPWRKRGFYGHLEASKSGRYREQRTLVRLDRMVANESWIEQIPKA
nr:hypothetical protein CFP56_47773 [Quercus suber]